MSAREVTVNFFNNTSFALERIDASLEHGAWEVEAPATIDPTATSEDPQTQELVTAQPAGWKCVSDGFATGVEGEANYRIVGATEPLHLWWDNPFAGSNEYDQTAPVGFHISRFGGAGDSAVVDWTLSGSGLSWHGWQALGHPSSGGVTSAPAVESRVENGIAIFDVFVKGQENALWQISSTDGGATWGSWINGAWKPQQWNKLGGAFQDAPAAISSGPYHVDVFVRGMDNIVARLWWG